MKEKDLRKLQKKWNDRLTKSGFKDIERADGSLINFDSHRLREMNPDSNTMIARQRYYELARQFYHDHTFDTSLEKEVWRLHSEGMIYDDIVKATRRKVSRSAAHRMVTELAKVMLNQRVGIRDRN